MINFKLFSYISSMSTPNQARCKFNVNIHILEQVLHKSNMHTVIRYRKDEIGVTIILAK